MRHEVFYEENPLNSLLFFAQEKKGDHARDSALLPVLRPPQG